MLQRRMPWKLESARRGASHLQRPKSEYRVAVFSLFTTRCADLPSTACASPPQCAAGTLREPRHCRQPQLGGTMPPAEQEMSEAAPAEALRTSFITLPDKGALREALESFWNDYGVQARPVCARLPRRRRARSLRAALRFGGVQAQSSECTPWR